MSVLPTSPQSLPVIGTQKGNLFSDRNSLRTWYLPALAPADPTSVFEFAASIGPTVDSQGHLFDTASVSIPLTITDPPDVTAAKAADPGGNFQMIPASSYDATLLVPYQDEQNVTQTTSVSGQVAAQPDGSLLVIFPGLLGPTVIQAYAALMSVGGMSVVIGYSYAGWQQLVHPFWRTFPLVPMVTRSGSVGGPGGLHPMFEQMAVDVAQPSTSLNPVQPEGVHEPTTMLGVSARASGTTAAAQPFPVVSIPFHRVDPPAPVWLQTTGRASLPLALGTVYGAPSYRPSYTIADPPPAKPRPIIDSSDLTDFTTTRSEYVELTSLGDVSTHYPSFSAVYFGQVTGTVVAIPAAYGIVHGSTGCRGSINAIVDTSPSSASGSQFQLSFELAPVVDPIDLAQLTTDLNTVPEAEGRTLVPKLPQGLAPGSTPTLSESSRVSGLSFANGPDASTIEVSFDVTDIGAGATLVPAWQTINELLVQLTAATDPPALFGTLSLLLDSAYPTPPTASYFLALTTVACADDLAVTIGGSPASALATNLSANDLALVRVRQTTSAPGASVVPIGSMLAAGAAIALPPVAGTDVTGALVTRTLAQPTPLSELPNLFTIQSQDVQQLSHLMTVDATAINFSAQGIGQISVQISLDGAPQTQIPALTLTPSHQVDEVSVDLPIGVAVVGLASTLTISVEAATTRQAEATNDFLTNPIFTLTSASLGEGVSD